MLPENGNSEGLPSKDGLLERASFSLQPVELKVAEGGAKIKVLGCRKLCSPGLEKRTAMEGTLFVVRDQVVKCMLI